MDFTFNPEEQSFQEQVRTFLAKTTADWVQPVAENEYYSLAQDMRHSLGQKDWLRIGWPKPYGHNNVIKEAILMEEMAYFRVPRANDYGTNLAGSLIINYGNPSQQNSHLARLAQGEDFWCVGFTEPMAGSHLSNIKTISSKTGPQYCINGQKDYGEWAHQSSWCHLLARSERGSTGSQGLTWFLLDMNSPGIFLNLVKYTTGRVFAEIFLDNVRVPDSHILGAPGDGWHITNQFLTSASIGTEFVGWSKRVRDLVLAFSDRRGRKLDNTHKNHLIDVSVDIEVARLLSYRSVWLKSQNQLSRSQASKSKLFCSEVFNKTGGVAVEMFGLLGQLDWKRGMENPGPEICDLFLEAAGGTITLGASAVHRNLITF